MKDFFRPTKGKIIISLILTAVWIILLSIAPQPICKCALSSFNNCTDYYPFLVIKNQLCHCSCVPLTEVVSQYIIFILVPFGSFYLLSCLGSMILSKLKRKRKEIK